MLLTAEICQWLNENLGVAATETALQEAYSFGHPLNVTRQLVQLETNVDAPISIFWKVAFFDGSGVPLLNGQNLQRRVFAGAALFANEGRGVVAQNLTLFLRNGIKRQKFATALYQSEEALFRAWGVREIHVFPSDDGMTVWMKSFKFQPKHPDLLGLRYSAWARHRNIPQDPPQDPADYPVDFLSEHGQVDLYKVLA